MIALAAGWIIPLLVLGGFALDDVLSAAIRRNFDDQLNYAATALIATAEVGPNGEARSNRPLSDQRFLEPYSGLYWQVSVAGAEPFRSRSLWDRALVWKAREDCSAGCFYNSEGFKDEPLRVVERDAVLPGAKTVFHFQVAQVSRDLDEQVDILRQTLWWSLGLLGLGLLILAGLQSTYGLWPLRKVSRAIAAIRSGAATRVGGGFPPEIGPMVAELNELLDDNAKQAEAARLHAGNLAHALKTPMSVLLGAARSRDPDLAGLVVSQTAIMQRHVDHQLARARAAGRRTASTARAEVWPALEGLVRTLTRIHAQKGVVIDIAGDRSLAFRGERQDLEEMLGNLLDNAAIYGGGRVFATVSRQGLNVVITIEDDGPGIPEADRARLFERGARLDTGKPGTGLGLAIVRDVAEIYEGTVTLEESEDLGGLCVTLTLPVAG
ncbi:MAG: HAMP domain-containing histidine kinase [Sphingomonadaceae bacterium]|nr:HAMP domain-containing histidine kinase [Sphingomonadaceae bacterium]